MNVYHAIPDDIKHFQLQQAELEHYFCHTNWQIYFSSWSPKGDLMNFLISTPARSIPYQLRSGNTKSHYNNE